MDVHICLGIVQSQHPRSQCIYSLYSQIILIFMIQIAVYFHFLHEIKIFIYHLLYFYFMFLQPKIFFPPGLLFECSPSHTSSPHLHKDVPIPQLPPTRAPHSLGSPVSWGLGISSLTKPRPNIPLLYMCWGASYQLVLLRGWSPSVREISGVQVN